jgi:hypothetical protein
MHAVMTGGFATVAGTLKDTLIVNVKKGFSCSTSVHGVCVCVCACVRARVCVYLRVKYCFFPFFFFFFFLSFSFLFPSYGFFGSVFA